MSLLGLDDPAWVNLRQAYGLAGDIPKLLRAATADLRSGSEDGTPWFSLWSALCHQEDVYTASYAAVPHLVALAPGHLARRSCDAIFLAAMIEACRREGRGPDVPEDLANAYTAAVSRGAKIAAAAVPSAWDADAGRVLEASAAALRGDAAGARRILGDEEE